MGTHNSEGRLGCGQMAAVLLVVLLFVAIPLACFCMIGGYGMP